MALVSALMTKTFPCINASRRCVHRWVRPTLQEMYRRRRKLGPEPERPRSSWIWNYNAELYAFGKRLDEEMDVNILRTVFTHKSYVDKEERNRKELGMSNPLLQLEYNSKFEAIGHQLIDSYVSSYLRLFFPRLPEEGIQSATRFLMSDDILGHVSFNIGTKDLILCEEFPPSKQQLITTLKAFIGALSENRGQRKAELFVQDFILTQLIGRDVNEMWEIINPMGLLLDIFRRDNRELPESRLLRETGRNTIKAVFNVGLYSARKLIGMGPGETLEIAEEMAARDALKRLFETQMETALLQFGKSGHLLDIPRNTKNPSVNEWSSKLFETAITRQKNVI